MTEHTPASEDVDAESRTTVLLARLRHLLRRFDPTLLGLLGLLSLPATVFDSLAFLEPFGIFFLCFFWILLGPLVDMALARGVDEETEPTDWFEVGGWREYAVSFLMLPLTVLNPLVMTQDLLQFVGGATAVVRYRGSLPDAESYEQQVSYRLPFEGTWTVVNGSPEREYSHSWIYVNQRYAYDFLITDEQGRSRPEGTSTAVENYYCYDEPVVAPADGVVVDTFDTALEASRGGGFSHPLKRSIPGGHVVIKHAESEYSFFAHLRPRSIAVSPGEYVTRGQRIGRCGHSGNSSEPHLHFQIQDRPDFAMAASLPVRFDDVDIEYPGVAHRPDLVPGYDVWHAGSPADPPDGYHDRTFVIEGQRVTHTERSGQDGPLWGGESAGVEPTDVDQHGDQPSVGPDLVAAGLAAHRSTSTLKRAAFALATSGVLAYAVGLFASSTVAAAVVGGAGIIALVVRAIFHGNGAVGRTGWLGTPTGFALAAGAVATGGIVGLELLVAGFLGYVLLSAAETRRLAGTPERPTGR
jgi:hypothetical protein